MGRGVLDRCGSAATPGVRLVDRAARRMIALAAVAGVAVALAAGPALAQTVADGTTGQPERPSRIQPPWRFSIRADNDAFNFWRPITDRPDKEYTNGDLVTLEVASAPWWGARFARRSRPCTGDERPGDRCLTTAFSLGQDMYTPAPGREPGRVADWRDERPYAAWLYARATARVVSERSLRTVALSLGVTGPPAFGELAQRAAHHLTGVYSRAPVGWDTQIGFEPGVVLAVRQSRRLAVRTASGRAVIDLVPHAGVSLGNILTEAEAGVEARAGVNLSNPWWTSEWRSRPAVELYVLGGARGEAVARNITLDGNTVNADRSVERVPLVGEYRVGVGARYRHVVVEWRAVTRGREYRTGPTAHAYSTMLVAYEMPVRGDR